MSDYEPIPVEVNEENLEASRNANVSDEEDRDAFDGPIPVEVNEENLIISRSNYDEHTSDEEERDATFDEDEEETHEDRKEEKHSEDDTDETYSSLPGRQDLLQEIASLKETVMELEGQIVDHVERNSNLQSTLDSAKDQIELTNAEIQKIQSEYSQLKAEDKQLELENEKLKLHMQQLQNVSEQKLTENEQLKAENQTLQRNKKDVEALQTENEELKRVLDQYKAENEQNQETDAIQRLKLEYDSEIKIHRSRIEDLELEVSALQDKNDDLESRIEFKTIFSMTHNFERLESELKQADNANKRLLQANETLHSRLKTTQKECNDLKKQLEKAQSNTTKKKSSTRTLSCSSPAVLRSSTDDDAKPFPDFEELKLMYRQFIQDTEELVMIFSTEHPLKFLKLWKKVLHMAIGEASGMFKDRVSKVAEGLMLDPTSLEDHEERKVLNVLKNHYSMLEPQFMFSETKSVTIQCLKREVIELAGSEEEAMGSGLEDAVVGLSKFGACLVATFMYQDPGVYLDIGNMDMELKVEHQWCEDGEVFDGASDPRNLQLFSWLCYYPGLMTENQGKLVPPQLFARLKADLEEKEKNQDDRQDDRDRDDRQDREEREDREEDRDKDREEDSDSEEEGVT